MTITKLLSGLPTRTMSQTDFDNANAKLYTDLPAWGQEVNATEAAMNILAAGGAYAIPYLFDTATADADPTAGKLRLSNAVQNASTVLRLDTTASDTKDYTGLIDLFDASSSVVKGSIRLTKMGDMSKFLTFDVTARATPAGYRNITVTNTGGSSASPFALNDPILLFFQRSGDKGSQGIQGTGFTNLVVIANTGTWQPPAGTTKAEIAVIDGGWSGGTVVSGNTSGGKGGDAGISIVTVDPAVVYTATIGAGAAAQGAGTNSNPVTGGSSSFSGAGFTTLTTANAALKVAGSQGISGGTGTVPIGGGSLYAPAQYGNTLTGYGGGGYGAGNNAPGISGRAGAIIIRY